MERAATEQLMARARLARPLQLLQLGEQQTRVGDRIDADVVAASVRGAAPERNIEPRESTVSWTDREPRWLGDDRGFRSDPRRQQSAHAEAFILLVDDRSDQDLSIPIRCGDGNGGGAHRGQPALHIGGAAPVNPVIAKVGGKRIVNHALDAHYIKVTIEHECRCIAWSNARHDIRAPGSNVRHLD